MSKNKDESEKEEWEGWKIVSDMLDNPDPIGIYATSECYKKLYDFVCSQKIKARESERQKIKKLLLKKGNGGGNWRRIIEQLIK